MITNANPAKQWQVPTNERFLSTYIASDGMLYAVMGDSYYGNDNINSGGAKSLFAFTTGGSIKWGFNLSDLFSFGNESQDCYTANFAAYDNNTLYLVCTDCCSVIANSSTVNRTENIVHNFLISVDQSGKVLWSLPFDRINATGSSRMDSLALSVTNDRLYLHVGLTEYVIDKSGNLLWRINNTIGQVAVASDDYVFAVPAVHSAINQRQFSYPYQFSQDGNAWNPSSLINAYYPNGTLFWSKDLGTDIVAYASLPLYNNDSLYLPIQDGFMSMDRDGNVLWSKHLDQFIPGKFHVVYEPLDLMPVDSAGNLYLWKHASGSFGSYNEIDVISPDGTNVTVINNDYLNSSDLNYPLSGNYIASKDTTVYYADNLSGAVTKAQAGNLLVYGPYKTNSLDNLSMVTVHAKNFLTGQDLWNFDVPVNNSTLVTIRPDNVDKLFTPGEAHYYSIANTVSPGGNSPGNSFSDGTYDKIMNYIGINVIPSGDVVYINFYTYAYENPVVFNVSKFNYYSGIYALDNNGRLLWQNQTDSYVYGLAVSNSTIYYNTIGGGLFETSIYIAGGVAFVVGLFVFINFFLPGTIARARDRLEHNENRKTVIGYIADNPGLTAREIARGLDINLGTIRYHVFILSLNHKLVTYKAGSKFLRYFTNSKSYSEAEQQAISLVRRDGMRKMFNLLRERPGISNRELSQILEMKESTVSRNLSELLLAGFVIKRQNPDGSTSYAIKDEQRALLEFALEKVKNDNEKLNRRLP